MSEGVNRGLIVQLTKEEFELARELARKLHLSSPQQALRLGLQALSEIETGFDRQEARYMRLPAWLRGLLAKVGILMLPTVTIRYIRRATVAQSIIRQIQD